MRHLSMLEALKYRLDGNDAFRQGEIETAIVKFRTALKLLEGENNGDNSIEQLRLVLHNNLSLCHIKQDEFDAGRDHAFAALDLNANHPKALYRAASCELELGKLDECARHLEQLLRVEPASADGHKLLAALRSKVEQSGNKVAALDAALQAVMGASAETFEATVLGCQVISQWLVQNGLPSELNKDATLTRLVHVLCMAAPLFGETLDASSNANSKATLVRIRLFHEVARLLVLLSLEPTADGAKHLHNDLTRRRATLRDQLDWASVARWAQLFISAGIATGRSGQDTGPATLRYHAVGSLLDLVQYLGNLDKRPCLELLVAGLETVEVPQLRVRTARIVSVMCDKRRKQGLAVPPLELSQPLKRLLELLVACLEDLFEQPAVIQVEPTAAAATPEEGFSLVPFALSTFFALLADDGDRPAEKKVDVVELLELLVTSRLTADSESDVFVALEVLNALWLASRKDMETFAILHGSGSVAAKYALQQTACTPQLSAASARHLFHLAEVPQIRNHFLENDNSWLGILAERCHSELSVELRCIFAGILSRFTLHSTETKQLIFDKLDPLNFCHVLLDDLDRYRQAAQIDSHNVNALTALRGLSQLLFTLSLHRDVKFGLYTGVITSLPDAEEETTLNHDPSPSALVLQLGKLGRLIAEWSASELGYAYAGMCQNLVRSRDDKDPLRKTAGGPDFDDEQLRQLQYIYDRLPHEAKDGATSSYDRGSAALAERLSACLVQDGNVFPALARLVGTVQLPELCRLCAKSFHYAVLRHPRLRGKIYQQGGYRVVRRALQTLEADDPDRRPLRQTLAHFAIAINPSLFTYSELMFITAELVNLLKDHYELYQYEAALGLTNIVSFSHEARMWLVADETNGWTTLRDVCTEENQQLSAAGLELLCNLAADDEVVSGFAQRLRGKGFSYDLAILLASTVEVTNARAASAAAGALAMMSSNRAVALALLRHERFKNIADAWEASIQHGNAAVQIRLATLMTHLWDALQWVVETGYSSEDVQALDTATFLIEKDAAEKTCKELFLMVAMVLPQISEEAGDHLRHWLVLYPACPARGLVADPVLLETLPQPVREFVRVADSKPTKEHAN